MEIITLLPVAPPIQTCREILPSQRQQTFERPQTRNHSTIIRQEISPFSKSYVKINGTVCLTVLVVSLSRTRKYKFRNDPRYI